MSLESLVFKSNKIFENELNYLLSSIINLFNFEYSFYKKIDHKVENCINKFLCNPEFSKSLKELHVQSSDSNFDSVFNCNHLNLTKFSINCNRPSVNLKNFECFLNKQVNLIYLGINFNPNNFSRLFPLMKSVCSKIQTIKYISFDFGFQVIENVNDLDFIWKFKGIEISAPNPQYFNSLTYESKLEELLYSEARLDVCTKFNFLPNLTSLYLHRAILDNSQYQAIFQYLLQLRKLCIIDALKVSSTTYLTNGF